MTLKYTRLLKLTDPHMQGADVLAWQAFVNVVEDGFGPETDRATRAMQFKLIVDVDGKVGKLTIAAANAYDEAEVTQPNHPIPTPVPPPDTEREPGRLNVILNSVRAVEHVVSLFLPARYFTIANRKVGDIKHIVLHTAEVAEHLESAEALAKVCNTWERKASWHFAVDNNSVTQSVRVKDVAWHAPGANKTGIGIEMAGRARQTPADWGDVYSVAMLANAAELVAALCHEWQLPPVVLSHDDLRAGKPGITTHDAVSKVFKKSDHWDPGPWFPINSFMSAVRAHLGEP